MTKTCYTLHMQITYRQAIETIKAIGQIPPLNNAPKAVHAIARNIRSLKAVLSGFEAQRFTAHKKHFPDTMQPKQDDPRRLKFTEELEELLNKEVSFEPHKFKVTDLNLEENAMKPDILAEVLWITEE